MEDNVIDYFENLLNTNSKVCGDCIEWTGKLNPGGYGYIYAYKKVWTAHRLSYLVNKGFLPDSLYICHKCNNKKCINPEHLYAGDVVKVNNKNTNQTFERYMKDLMGSIERIIDRKINETLAKEV